MQKDLLFAFGQTVRKIRLSKDISQEKFAPYIHKRY